MRTETHLRVNFRNGHEYIAGNSFLPVAFRVFRTNGPGPRGYCRNGCRRFETACQVLISTDGSLPDRTNSRTHAGVHKTGQAGPRIRRFRDNLLQFDYV